KNEVTSGRDQTASNIKLSTAKTKLRQQKQHKQGRQQECIQPAEKGNQQQKYAHRHEHRTISIIHNHQQKQSIQQKGELPAES
ncbi:hypothetical protein Tco_0288651, partial [Tanacetum coccineum]